MAHPLENVGRGAGWGEKILVVGGCRFIAVGEVGAGHTAAAPGVILLAVPPGSVHQQVAATAGRATRTQQHAQTPCTPQRLWSCRLLGFEQMFVVLWLFFFFPNPGAVLCLSFPSCGAGTTLLPSAEED